MKDKPFEQETIIRWDESEEQENWIIYSSHRPTCTKLRHMGYQVKRELGKGIEFVLPPGSIKIRNFSKKGFDFLGNLD